MIKENERAHHPALPEGQETPYLEGAEALAALRDYHVRHEVFPSVGRRPRPLCSRFFPQGRSRAKNSEARIGFLQESLLRRCGMPAQALVAVGEAPEAGDDIS